MGTDNLQKDMEGCGKGFFQFGCGMTLLMAMLVGLLFVLGI